MSLYLVTDGKERVLFLDLKGCVFTILRCLDHLNEFVDEVANCFADRFVPVAINEDEVAAGGGGVVGAFNGVHSFDVDDPEVETFRNGLL